jgi:hypothetical protein
VWGGGEDAEMRELGDGDMLKCRDARMQKLGMREC